MLAVMLASIIIAYAMLAGTMSVSRNIYSKYSILAGFNWHWDVGELWALVLICLLYMPSSLEIIMLPVKVVVCGVWQLNVLDTDWLELW